jgi:hypothetical protein
MQADFSDSMFMLRNKMLDKMDEEPTITLRDFLAGCALIGLGEKWFSVVEAREDRARWAYAEADAMVKAREDER